MPATTPQWRVPVGMQLVLGGIMSIGLFFLKESPRWLCKQGRHEQAIASLAHVRCKTPESPEIIQEMAEIRASIEEELNATEGVTWRECLTPGNRYVATASPSCGSCMLTRLLQQTFHDCCCHYVLATVLWHKLHR